MSPAPELPMSGPDFVRSCPDSMTPAEILAEAERIGVALTKKQIDNARYSGKRKSRAAAATQRTAPKSKSAAAIDPNSIAGRVFAFCRDYIAKEGRGPTSPVIATAAGCTAGGVSNALKTLRGMHLLTYEPGNYQSMKMVGAKRAAPEAKGPAPEANGHTPAPRAKRRKRPEDNPFVEQLETIKSQLAVALEAKIRELRASHAERLKELDRMIGKFA